MSLVKRMVQNGMCLEQEFLDGLEGKIFNDPGLRSALRGIDHSIARESSKGKPFWVVRKSAEKAKTFVGDAKNVF